MKSLELDRIVETKNKLLVTRDWADRNVVTVLMVTEFSVWGNENILEIGDTCTTLWM